MPGFLDDLATVNAARGDVTNVGNLLKNGLSNPIGTLDQLQGLANKYFGGPGGGGRERSQMDEMLDRKDPMTSIDWVALVVSGGPSIGGIRLDSIQTPSISIDTREVFRTGKQQHYAGNMSVGSINISLYSDISGRAMKFASSWVNSVYDSKTGNYRLPKDYKKTIILTLFDPTFKEVCVFRFFGCWPTSWASYSFGTGSAELIPTTMELSVDSFSVSSGKAETEPVVSTIVKMNPFQSISSVLGQANAVKNLFGL